MSTLLPLRAVTIRLQFLQAGYAPFFHQPQLKPFLKELLQDKAALDNEQGLWVEALESGNTIYKKGDEYRFILFCTAPAWGLFVKLLDRIRRLPQSYPKRREQSGLFADNLQFIGLRDYFTNASITHHEQLFRYDESALQREINFWQAHDTLILRFTSPTRLKRQKQPGIPPYIRDRGQLHPGEIERRIYKALCNLDDSLRTHCHSEQTSYPEVSDRLFWTDNAKTLKSNGKIAPFGGVMGDITLRTDNPHNPHLALLILAQYTGIGERRSYGLGRFRLQGTNAQGTTPPKTNAQSYLQRTASISTLELACYNMAHKHPYMRHYIEHTLAQFDPDLESILEDQNHLNHINLHNLGDALKHGDYHASVLQGVILRRPGRHPRPLAIPPLKDRIAQRAAVEILSPGIEQLASSHSYGYRKGMSRMQARDQILMLNRQGYQWFFEADIEEFFDLVSHSEIENRLLSFYPDEPLIALIMEWIRAPVQFDGELIERPAGLPQGSPISPMLANLMLEDFDTDLEAAGMKLIRFADDFVVLCKSRHQAQQAAQRAKQSLNELGLEFNPEKTGIGEFSDGFDFLGYTFLSALAIEKHRSHEAPGKLQLDNIPGASWLATLLNRDPQRLRELNNRLDQKQQNHKTQNTSVIIRNQPANNTLPENKLGSTLFITPPCKNITQKNGQLEIADTDKTTATKNTCQRQNWNELAHIVLIGRHNISQPCQTAALKHQVGIHYLTQGGKYLGITTHRQPAREGAELWLQQTRSWQEQNPHTLKLAKALVSARIHNQREVIRQRERHHSPDSPSPLPALQKLIQNLQDCNNMEQLRGYEGQASSLYFARIANWIPETFGFSSRQKRPAPDPMNALLSLGYTILYSHTASILQIAGLYPWQGFYHRGYGRHFALASDLMEVHRHLVERCAISLLRSAQLKAEDFYQLPGGACQLTQAGIRLWLTQLSQRMLKPIQAKHSDKKLTTHEHLMQQSIQLVQHLRDEHKPVEFYRLK